MIPTDGSDAGSGKALVTIDDVNIDICKKLNASGNSDCCQGDVPYLIGCAFSDIWYLDVLFPNISNCTTIADVNELVSNDYNKNKRLKIGNYEYKFSLSTTETKLVKTACDADKSVAGMPVFTYAG